jgi:hypothetical protein
MSLFVVPPMREFVHLVSVSSMFGLLATTALFAPIQARHLGARFDALQEKWVLPRVLQLAFVAGMGAVYTFVRPFLPLRGVGSVDPLEWLRSLPFDIFLSLVLLALALAFVAANLLVFEPLAARAYVAMHKRRQDAAADEERKRRRAGVSAAEEVEADSGSDTATLAWRWWHGIEILSIYASIAALLFYYATLARTVALPTPSPSS